MTPRDEAKLDYRVRGSCHVCSAPLPGDVESCPECGAAIVDISELLDEAKGEYSKATKRKRRKIEIPLSIDMLCTFVIGWTLVGSLMLQGQLFLVIDQDAYFERGLGLWTLAYDAFAILALFATISLERTNQWFHMMGFKKLLPNRGIVQPTPARLRRASNRARSEIMDYCLAGFVSIVVCCSWILMGATFAIRDDDKFTESSLKYWHLAYILLSITAIIAIGRIMRANRRFYREQPNPS